jgi:hypothetical protein
MATVGRLNILVGANIAPLKAGLKNASTTVSGFASGIAKGLGNVGGMVKSAIAPIATVGVAAFTAGFVKASSAIDDIAKKSDSLGIATEELIGLRHAGKLAGVEADALDTGLGKMLKTIGGAQSGSAEAIKAIESLGISIEDLQGLTTTQQFGKIADAINSFENPALRAAAATEIFGKNFLQLMPLLTGGSTAVKAASVEADKLGLTFSRLDASKVEGMNDAFTKLSSSIGGVLQKIAIEVAPTFETAFNSAASSVSDLGTTIATFVNESINNILFFASTWNQQWKLMTLNAEIELQKILPQTHAALTGKLAPLGELGPSELEIKRDVLLRDITAEREQWERLREARLHPAKDESAFFGPKAVLDAQDEAAFFGPKAVLDTTTSLVLEKSKKWLDMAKDESAFFEDSVAATKTEFGPSSMLAGATQAGTTAAASQIFAGMAEMSGGTDEVADNTAETADNTAETANNTGRIADAMENWNLGVVEAF